MNRFQVWLRPSNRGCKVRVDGVKNAKWLLNRLSESFVFKSSEAMNEHEFFPACVFGVVYGWQMSHPVFKQLLSGMPEVELMIGAA
jgi:hypothetical protein